jgi:riboflavin kinase/FMN adenylyltransferase
MMNIGFNPTVAGEDLSIEIHYFDFSSDLYDQEISVSILHYIRPEEKFNSVDLLKVQLEKDKTFALDYLD